MKCEEAQEYFADYLADTLDEARLSELLRHLFACTSCREEAEGLRDMWMKGRAVPAESVDLAPMRRNFRALLATTAGTSRPAAVFGRFRARQRVFQALIAIVMLSAVLFAAQRTGVLTTLRLMTRTPPEPVHVEPPPPPEAAAIPVVQQETGTVEGVVLQPGTADPVPDAEIAISILASAAQTKLDSVMASNGAQQAEGFLTGYMYSVMSLSGKSSDLTTLATAVTDSGGHFVFPNLAAGKYVVLARCDGYFGSNHNPVVSSVTVTTHQTAKVRLSMIRGSSITGRVVESSGRIVSDATVQLLRVGYSIGSASLLNTRSIHVDDRGEYRLSSLEAGEYYVAAVPGTNAVLRPRGSTPLRTFYPSATDTAKAVPVVLKGGNDVTGVDILIQTGTSFRVSGRVIDARASNAAQIATAALTLIPQGTGTLLDSSGMFTSAASMSQPNDGRFEIPNVPPGRYELFATLREPVGTAPGARGGGAAVLNSAALSGEAVLGRTLVDVRVSDLKDVAVTLHSGVLIAGRVTLDGGALPSNDVRVSLQVMDSPADFYEYLQLARPRGVVDGAFEIPSVPEGRYQPSLVRLMFNGGLTPTSTWLEDAYVADILQGGASIYDSGLQVGPQSAEPLSVLLKSAGGIVDGTVVDAQGKAAVGATVVLVPPSNRRGNSALFKTAKADANGKFLFRGVPPGEYKLLGWESIQANAYLNSDFLARYETRGNTVTVSGGATISPQIRVISNTDTTR